jgi:hypothetical protein
MSRVSIEHLDSACTAGWSALIDQPIFADQRPRRLELICWSCRRVVELSAWTAASDDPGGYGYQTAGDIPAEHRPALAVSTSGTGRFPASVPPERVAGALVHIEAWLGQRREDAYQWLVTDRAGNVLGLVERSWTARGALRFRWGTWEDAAGHGEGFHSRDAAVRALLRAVPAARSTRREPDHQDGTR